MITAPQAQVLRMLKQWGEQHPTQDASAGWVGRKMWPGKRAWQKAGQMLNNMQRLGLVRSSWEDGVCYWCITNQGDNALAEHGG